MLAHMIRMLLFLFLALSILCYGTPKVSVGSEQLFTEKHKNILRGKRIGLITNHTGVDSRMVTTAEKLKEGHKHHLYRLTAIFAPEHGINGSFHAEDNIQHGKDPDGIPIFSLYGKTKRPTEEMLKDIDLLVYDIQDVGSRSYTYISTLFYAMEEAAKKRIPVVILDRPNPINGRVVDGPMLEEKWRSIVGYINVPYVHGMTIAELASFFNKEYNIGAKLYIIPMLGWNRDMTFQDTGLPWIPTSPHIPDSQTPLYYPATGILGELPMVNIGIGYTLPFKVVGAPWIDALKFCEELNKQNFPGILFKPFYYKPFYGNYSGKDCQGALLVITNPLDYRPVSTQYLIIGILKALHPKEFKEALEKAKGRRDMFAKVNGTDKVWWIMSEQRNIVWKLREIDQDKRTEFLKVREKYLLSDYGK